MAKTTLRAGATERDSTSLALVNQNEMGDELMIGSYLPHLIEQISFSFLKENQKSLQGKKAQMSYFYFSMANSFDFNCSTIASWSKRYQHINSLAWEM